MLGKSRALIVFFSGQNLDAICAKWNEYEDCLLLNFSDYESALLAEKIPVSIRILDGSMLYNSEHGRYVDNLDKLFRKVASAFPKLKISNQSWWQFSELSTSNILLRTEFLTLFQLHIILQYLKDFPALEYHSDRRNDGLRDLLVTNDLLEGAKGKTRSYKNWLPVIKYVFYFRLKALVSQLWLKRKLSKSQSDTEIKRNSEEPKLFLSSVRNWKTTNSGFLDDYYSTYSQDIGSKQVFLLEYQFKPSGLSRQEIKSYIRKAKDIQNGDSLALEGFSSYAQVLSSYFNAKNLYLWFRRSLTNEGKEAFTFENYGCIDLFKNLIWKELALNAPHYDLNLIRAKNVVRHFNPSELICYTFEFNGVKALISGFKDSKVHVTGIQHGPISFHKLLYSRYRILTEQVIPDRVLVDGQLPKEILVKGGLDTGRIITIGPIRLLHRVFDTNDEKSSSEGKAFRVVVTPGHADSEFAVNFVYEALKDISGLDVYIKIHPKSGFQLDRWMRDKPEQLTNFVFDDPGDLYALLRDADLNISTYSSVAVETLKNGVNSVLISSNHTPNYSPLNSEQFDHLMRYDSKSLRTTVLNEMAQPSHLSWEGQQDKAFYDDSGLPYFKNIIG